MAKERIEDEVELIMHIRGEGLDGGSNFLALSYGVSIRVVMTDSW